MARLRLICLLLFAGLAIHFTATAIQAQRQMTVDDLVRFIRSAISQKNDDRQVADQVRKLKLTNKLDARTVEELQSAGAGRQTMAALRAMITATATLPDAPPPEPAPAVVTIPPPSPEDQRKTLDEIRQNALDYTKNLPNFICTQLTRRYVDSSGTGSFGFKPVDTIQEQLSYVDGMENYKVVLVNNLPVNNLSHLQLGGTTSSGEFGTMLREIFDPETQTEFEWTRWATWDSRRAHVYSFRVRQANSKYSIHEDQTNRTIVAGYHGLIYADRDTGLVMRIYMECDGLETFPITAVKLDLKYNFVKIESGEYLLPLSAELTSRGGRLMTKNDVQFGLYKKFGAEATITFDPLDPPPDDQLKEQPAKPDPAKK